MHHLKTTKPLTIEQLMVDVNDFASQLDQETVKKAVKDIITITIVIYVFANALKL